MPIQVVDVNEHGSTDVSGLWIDPFPPWVMSPAKNHLSHSMQLPWEPTLRGSASRCPAWVVGARGGQGNLPRGRTRGRGLKGRFRLDMREIVFMGREVRHWNRAIVEAPSWMCSKTSGCDTWGQGSVVALAVLCDS